MKSELDDNTSGPIMEITQDGPFLIIERDRFVARFPAALEDDLEQLQDQDIYVTVTGGPTYYVSLMTLEAIDAIDAVLRRWAQTGEAAGGRYFYTTDLVITPQPGITAMIEAEQARPHPGRRPLSMSQLPAASHTTVPQNGIGEAGWSWSSD